ncbi:MAG: hypothetical protein WC665_03010 [Sulfurimonas sp.]
MENSIILYLTLLLSKGQFYKAKEFFEMEKYQLKDRYKPIWYALMKLMEKEFPDEIKKWGVNSPRVLMRFCLRLKD